MLHFLQDGPLLNATNVTRADGGEYVVVAKNSEGSGTFRININVQCKWIDVLLPDSPTPLLPHPSSTPPLFRPTPLPPHPSSTLPLFLQ